MQISRVARRRQIEVMEVGKSRMVHGLLQKWPSLTRESLLIEEVGWIVNTDADVLTTNAKRVVQALQILPENFVTVVSATHGFSCMAFHY